MGALYAGFILTVLPGCQVLRDGGLMMYTALLLWGSACVVLWRWPAVEQLADGSDTGLTAAA